MTLALLSSTMNTNELISQLRKFVLIKSGLRNIDPAHCKTISEYIFKETKNYVSETTVKRFFGFAQVIHKFSLFTLNSLSQYVGFSDWESFCKDKQGQSENVDDVWTDLQIRCRAITEMSIISKKNNSGVPFDATSNRSFLFNDFDYFLKNNYQFTTITAQPGQGKSILITHLVEHFFYGENAVYNNDIVLLINSDTINELIQNDLSLKDWFRKEFKFGGVSDLNTHFKKNPTECKGHFILIVDGIDQFLSQSKYLKVFTDFLLSIEESNFLKIVLGLRVNNWVNMQPIISGSAFLTKAWYKGLFFDEEKGTNVPLLNKDEILFTLSRLEGKIILEKDVHPELIKQFRTPFWLQIYYKLKQENNTIRLNNYLLCIELISYFLENKICLSKNSTEKIIILKDLSNSISKGSVRNRVAKDKVLNSFTLFPEAYNELVYGGILIEEKRLTTSIPTEIIRFLNDDIYTYFLFLQLKEKFHFKPDGNFFKEILTVYSEQSHLRSLMLNWSIRFCINRNELQALKHIFKLPFTNDEKNMAFDFICDVAVFELNRSGSNFNSQTIDIHFIDIMVMGKIVSQHYKETIKKIAEKIVNEDIQIMLNVIECSICVVDMDEKGLNESMHLLKRYPKELYDLFPINPSDLLLFLSNNLSNKPNNGKSVFDKINVLQQQLDESRPHTNDELTSVEIMCYRLAFVVLFTNKNYEACGRFIEAILKKYPKIFYLRSSVFSSYLLILLVQTYIKLDQNKKAKRIIQLLDKIIHENKRYFTPYIKSAYHICKANFLNHNHNYSNALVEIEKGLESLNGHQFKILEISFRLLKIDVLKHSDSNEYVNQSIRDLLNYLSINNLSMPDFANVSGENFDHMFKILKSYKHS
ncbi:hypothetical protein [Pedobacter jejuensis]|uniref:NACHT domain-containing protein n=1 Tax=Pedobacter jejuensis TaxID=1268550 RepID=A0A3N0C2N9_9SPHI|nr:hypothetical protein [Pedobacter jejuensis]RNL56671.1 hypothetical protein D7004_01910 [Pedobacter jejuensis]